MVRRSQRGPIKHRREVNTVPALEPRLNQLERGQLDSVSSYPHETDDLSHRSAPVGFAADAGTCSCGRRGRAARTRPGRATDGGRPGIPPVLYFLSVVVGRDDRCQMPAPSEHLTRRLLAQ